MSQQPVDQEYPNTEMTRDPSSSSSSSSSHSNGSFGPVFAVLAVIIVVSAVACVVGRLCSRRSHRGKEGKHHHPTTKGGKQSQGLGPKEWESRQKPSYNMRDGEIEFAFDKRSMPSSKGGMNGGGKGGKPPHGHKPADIRFSDNV